MGRGVSLSAHPAAPAANLAHPTACPAFPYSLSVAKFVDEQRTTNNEEQTMVIDTNNNIHSPDLTSPRQPASQGLINNAFQRRPKSWLAAFCVLGWPLGAVMRLGVPGSKFKVRLPRSD